MTRVAQKSFASGELGGLMRGQSDLDFFRNGCIRLKNGIVTRVGSIRKRFGSFFENNSADPDGGRLIPASIPGVGEFLLEIGDESMRVWKDGSILQSGVNIPYSLAEAELIHYAQSIDTLFLAQSGNDVQVVTFTSSGVTVAELSDVGVSPAIGLQLKVAEFSKLAGQLTLDSSPGRFESGDALTRKPPPSFTDEFDKSTIWRVNGIDFLIGVDTPAVTSAALGVQLAKFVPTDTSGFSFSADKQWCGPWKFNLTLDTDAGVKSDAGDITSGGTPQFVVRDNSGGSAPQDELEFGVVHEIIATSGHTAASPFNQPAIAYFEPKHVGTVFVIGETDHNDRTRRRVLILSIRGTETAGKFTTADCILVSGESLTHIEHETVYAGESFHFYLRDRETRDVANTNTVSMSINSKDSGATGVQLSAAAADWPTSAGPQASDANIFTQADVDSNVQVNLNGGVFTITGWGPGVTGNGPWHSVLGNIGAGGLTSVGTTVVWSKTGTSESFASAVTIHQERLVLGGFSTDPEAVAFSRSGSLLDFTIGADDDDAMIINIQDSRGGGVQWLTSLQDLIVGTDDAEFAIKGTPITPTSLGADKQGTSGSSQVQALLIGREAVFASRTGEDISATSFRFETDRYIPVQLTDLNPDLFEGNPVKSWAFLRDPDPLLVAVRQDGSLAVLSYRQGNQIAGWSEWKDENAFFVTHPKFFSVAAVRRPGLPDQLWALVERKDFLSGTTTRIEIFDVAEVMDSSVTVTGSLSGQISGFSALANRIAQVLVDGVYIGDKQVSPTGTIDLGSSSGSTVKAGLPIPFLLQPQALTFPDRKVGDFAGRTRQVKKMHTQLERSVGGTVEGGSPLAPFTLGVAETEFSGWSRSSHFYLRGEEASPTILQQEPFPFHVLSVTQEVELED